MCLRLGESLGRPSPGLGVGCSLLSVNTGHHHWDEVWCSLCGSSRTGCSLFHFFLTHKGTGISWAPFHHLLGMIFGTFCLDTLPIHTLWDLVTLSRLTLQNGVHSLLLKAQHMSYSIPLPKPGGVFSILGGETPKHSSCSLILSFGALENKTRSKRLTSFVPFPGMRNIGN